MTSATRKMLFRIFGVAIIAAVLAFAGVAIYTVAVSFIRVVLQGQ